MKKPNEDVRLLIARLINEENERFSLKVGILKDIDVSDSKKLIEVLSYTHKEKIDLLNYLYGEV